MKIQLLFIYTFILSVTAFSNTRAQGINLIVKEKSLTQIIKLVEQSTSYTFVYDFKEVQPYSSISINLKNVAPQEAMTKILKNTNLDFKLFDNTIVIKKKEGIKINPQEKAEEVQNIVEGTVTDSTGKPLPFVSVTPLEKNIAAVSSNGQGKFSIQTTVPVRLRFSLIGYSSKTIEVNSYKHLNIVLSSQIATVEEVVVVGFGTQKKENLTGAVSSVKMDEVLGNRPVVSVAQALQGVVPGLSMPSTNGVPGQNASYNIRGITSINGGGNAPLVLVNNVPMDINLVDPQDIESVSILKDAGSSAIYGARAAFGVILITTKKGKRNQKPQITYNNNFAFSSAAELPEKASPLEEVTAYGKMGFSGDLYVDGRDINKWKEYIEDYQQNPDKYPLEYYFDTNNSLYWVKENQGFDLMMADFGFQQNHNTSISGGSENSQYRIGLGFTNEDGIIITNKDAYKRANISAYYEIDIKPWLTSKIDVRYAGSNKSLVADGGRGGIWGNVMSLPSWYSIKDSYTLNGIEYPYESSATYVKYGAPRTNKRGDMRLFGALVIKPIQNLSLTGEFTYDKKNNLDKVYLNNYPYMDKGLANVIQSVTQTSFATTTSFTDYKSINAYANYKRQIQNHNFGFTLGFNQEWSYLESLYSYNTDILVAELPSLSVASGTPVSYDGFSEFAVRGAFYRVNYDYQGKFLFEANGRYDGSSRFPKASRFGFFPSFSAGYRISEESYMQGLDPWLSDLKFRGSWGQIGNQNINNYAFIPGMVVDKNYKGWLIDGSQVLTFNQPAMVSTSFTWERVETLDVGADAAFMNNRLNATFDWYRRDTKGMLAPGMDLPAVVGSSAPTENTASLRTNGWELKLDWKDKVGEIGYRVGGGIYDTKSHITKYDDNDTYSLSTYYKNQQIGEIWGYQSIRLAQESDFDANGNLIEGLFKYKTVTKLNPGDVLYEDLDGDQTIWFGDNTLSNPGDRRIIGNNQRRYQYSLTGGVNWKNFDLSLILQGVGKRDIWRTDQMTWPTGTWGANFKDNLDFWSTDNTQAFYPRVYANDAVNTSTNHLTQSRYLANGAYLRLQNISLSYAFSPTLLTKIGAASASIFFSGENLYTWHHLPKGLDPEMASAGSWSYPFMKKYAVGININF
ncbi:TonB-dependent receptor [Sphingobacterium kyonggiense]